MYREDFPLTLHHPQLTHFHTLVKPSPLYRPISSPLSLPVSPSRPSIPISIPTRLQSPPPPHQPYRLPPNAANTFRSPYRSLTPSSPVTSPRTFPLPRRSAETRGGGMRAGGSLHQHDPPRPPVPRRAGVAPVLSLPILVQKHHQRLHTDKLPPKTLWS